MEFPLVAGAGHHGQTQHQQDRCNNSWKRGVFFLWRTGSEFAKK